jgi:hypothetical protein
MTAVIRVALVFRKPSGVGGKGHRIGPIVGHWRLDRFLPRPSPPSGIWPLALEHQETAPPEPVSFDTKWAQAAARPQRALELVEAEIQAGFVREWKGTFEEARAIWPRAACGKLNIVSAPGKDDRLVLDTSVTEVNP